MRLPKVEHGLSQGVEVGRRGRSHGRSRAVVLRKSCFRTMKQQHNRQLNMRVAKRVMMNGQGLSLTSAQRAR